MDKYDKWLKELNDLIKSGKEYPDAEFDIQIKHDLSFNQTQNLRAYYDLDQKRS